MADHEALTAPDSQGVGEGQRLGAEPLEAFLARTPRLAVALSGGCDSACLLAAASRAGCEVRAYAAVTPFQTPLELADARRAAEAFGVPLDVLPVDVLDDPAIRSNPPERCYLCKGRIFSAIIEAADRDGIDVVADGTNASDDPSRRPGFRALAELGVVSPLRRAAMTKAQVRAMARRLGVPTADKPRFSCLAVQVPTGEPLTEASLRAADGGCAGVQ